MKIKLIALDLDGTLLTSDKVITARTKQTLARAMAQGTAVTIATGRMLCSALYFAHVIASKAPVICCNGAFVGRESGTPVFARYHDPALARRFLTFCYERSWYVNWYIGMEIYAPAYREEYFSAYRTTEHFSGHAVGQNYLPYTNNVPQFVLRDLTADIGCYAREVTEHFGGALLPQQNTGTSIDITPPGISKAVGVQALADAMGIGLDAVMVAGDADNDLDMLAMGAFSVVPENGTTEAKERASFVTASHDADGIAKAIEKYVL